MQRSTIAQPSAETAARAARNTQRREKFVKFLRGTRDKNGLIKLLVIYGLFDLIAKERLVVQYLLVLLHI